MGVMYDYFRAPSEDEALRARTVRDGPVREFDGVETKWIDPHVALGKLVGFVRGVPWSLDIVSTTCLWPPRWTDAEEGVEELDEQVRDVLASVDDGSVPELAARWAGIEEFRYFSDSDSDWARSLVQDLVGLARRAKGADERLYCFSCV